MHANETPATYEQIHRALLAGLLGNIGFKNEEGDDYLGARGDQVRDLSRLGAAQGASRSG